VDSSHTDYSPHTTEITERLQTIISTWNGAQRGQPLADLHQVCVNAVGGRGNSLFPRLLPVSVLMVADLGVSHLQAALKRYNGVGRNTRLQFRVPPTGLFDSVLIPIGRADERPDRFLLAIEQRLSLQDQVALYAHAVGHLLLNYQEVQMGKQRPSLAPQNGFAHPDTLAELRLLETVKQEIDRRVLETFTTLTKLLETPEESVVAFDTATADLKQLLQQAGWRGQFVQMRHVFTDGRVLTSSQRHGTRLSVDALLRAATSLPIAIVHSLRAGEGYENAVSRIQSYARRMAVPFAYLLTENGTIQEFAWNEELAQFVVTTLTAFPGRDALWQRWAVALQLTEPLLKRVLHYPYRVGGKIPRYYQEAAINTAVIAVLQALRGLRSPRILLTLATGTGKTHIAFQLLWKLKRERAVGNILFLTDRDFLLSQAMDNEFAPFGDGRHRIQGELSTAYDINFATYQGITGPDQQRYLSFQRNFFQVIIVDECHRGSAQETSAWREVLKHFSSAIQIGLTATPLSTDEVQTDEYFGRSLYKYSLRMGINDGFLAPYRVRRVLIGQDDEQPAVTAAEVPQEEPVAENVDFNEDEPSFVDIPASMETPRTMLSYTQPIAQHLADFLHRTDLFAKTIVFCVDQQHAEAMRLALEVACAAWKPQNAAYITRIVSDEGTEGRHALGDFTSPDENFPVIVTTSKLLSTGVDVPTCKNIVLARPVGSLVEFKQIIGRGTRLFVPQKRWFTILDYAGTIKHFFDPDFDGDPELVEQEPLEPPLVEAEIVTEDTSSSVPTSAPFQEDEQADKPADDGVFVPLDEGLQPATDAPRIVHDEVPAYPPIEPYINSVHTPTRDEAPHVSYEHEGQTQQEVQPVEMPHTNDDTPHNNDISSLEAEEHSDTTVEAKGAEGSTNALVERPIVEKRTRDGRVFKVVGEMIYELGSDGTTLRRGTYRECAITTIHRLMATPEDLRARWLKDEQRAEIISRLEDEGVDIQELAYQQRLLDLDPLDLLLHIVFHEPIVTRTQRVERLRRNHSAFFAHYQNNLIARGILDIILEKYMHGDAPDVSDVGLLNVISIADRHTPMELAQPFAEGKTTIRDVLKQLQTLLYHV